jgi:hypothetical protein
VSLRTARLKTSFGALVLAGATVGLAALVASPSVARPAGRVLESLTSALDDERAGDVELAVASLDGIHAGLPVFLVEADGSARAVAHVHAMRTGSEGAYVTLRFAPRESSAGPWSLTAYPPSRKLRAALDVTVTPEAAGRFAGEVTRRLETLWDEAILPDAEQNFPAFVKRIDPTRETAARKLVQGVTADVMRALRPMLDELSGAITSAMKRKFDLLDKLGLGFKFLRGDARGIKRKVMPVVEAAAQQWWAVNQNRVMRAVGEALRARLEDVRTWAGGELFDAAREELFQPILAAQRTRLEADSEALLRYVAREFIESPGGGFRIRFASMLRTHLLNKKTALLLIERPR